MRAAVIREGGEKFEISNVTIDEPMEQEVLVDVRAPGLCHSDTTVAKMGMGVGMPIVLGHEIAGVAAVGSAVSRVSVGDHVVAAAVQPCGQRRARPKGSLWACPNPDTLNRDPSAVPRLHDESGSIGQLQGLGGFAEQALIHANRLVAIDPAMPFEQASLIGCAVATGGGAVFNVAKVEPGQSVAVFGCGRVDLNAIQTAVPAGATRIIGADIQPDKLELARKFGATDIIDSSQVNVVEAIGELTESDGVHHAFVTVGPGRGRVGSQGPRSRRHRVPHRQHVTGRRADPPHFSRREPAPAVPAGGVARFIGLLPRHPSVRGPLPQRVTSALTTWCPGPSSSTRSTMPTKRWRAAASPAA
ncbi:alcohol dehydrogenase [Streptomyces sp. NTH33]|uniref:alcohol dehydrogenase catalytic domain-containing protein n=1 Tax=Streptomyces sp. NTH33 TaxID=1735453 RepID=UPI000DA7FD09|nr:alcohol dehydrogenase catalytic domain-containing protein [Streptomyces sp. NTH33]PZH18830.1 alcohol dehydrogenase [Streptomyces sp. NTH33]